MTMGGTHHGSTAAPKTPAGKPEGGIAPPGAHFEGFCLWITGLPSAGKTTLGALVRDRLKPLGYRVELLDGDEIRRGLSSDLGFDRAAREAHARRVTFVAKVLARNGVIPIVTLISPYRAWRAAARAEIGRFVEVYVATPLAVCEERDVKGLYKKARAGEIKEMTGVDDPFEAPESPELRVETVGRTPEESARYILGELTRLRFLPAA
jgi:adenylylsulfate kinase